MRRTIDFHRMFRIVPVIGAIGFATGCTGEGAPQTAEPPKMEKAALPSENQGKPAKGMDRLGSESPNP